MLTSSTSTLRRPAFVLALCLVACLGIRTEARADSAHIVAIGADNVAGSGKGKHRTGGVGPSEAFPAQLEGLLQAQGVDATVSNAGVAGDTILDIV